LSEMLPVLVPVSTPLTELSEETALPPSWGILALHPSWGILALPPSWGILALPPSWGILALPPSWGILALPPSWGILGEIFLYCYNAHLLMYLNTIKYNTL